MDLGVEHVIFVAASVIFVAVVSVIVVAAVVGDLVIFVAILETSDFKADVPFVEEDVIRSEPIDSDEIKNVVKLRLREPIDFLCRQRKTIFSD